MALCIFSIYIATLKISITSTNGKSILRFSPQRCFSDRGSARGTVCLDYRDHPNRPRVISYESASSPYHVAQDFKDFLTKLYFNIEWQNAISETSPTSLKLNLDQLEDQWGIRLPLRYKKLVLQSNRGQPDRTVFYYEKGKEGVEHLLRVDTKSEKSVYGVYKKHFDGTSCYSFAKCLSGSYLCHDYREENPSVSLWNPQDQCFYPLKSSFARFLHSLRY